MVLTTCLVVGSITLTEFTSPTNSCVPTTLSPSGPETEFDALAPEGVGAGARDLRDHLQRRDVDHIHRRVVSIGVVVGRARDGVMSKE